ncbi:ATP-grasp domain-containing protein [Staphylococcus felis]|uniref:ATP-grasp domain-containing protein n=1 Tax=Staphylococcus felis TaxID=46127 RepID=A0ABS0QQR1_9STAP|nr:ATP-grasp domain-containing protein [Staphylococcus felis]MBH9581346.1 ATP-grasp domain-containing protein [Staphylococcus felis]MDM8327141.1 ATP-grasp domain-containing protein [Staphylococcus felis]
MTKYPKMTMGDLYDTNVVYTSRPSYVSNPWLETNEHQSNFLTGRELLISNLPVIVHEASVTHRLETLFQLIGRTIPKNVYTFKNQETYENLLKRLAYEENRHIYFQYVHGEDIVTGDKYAMDKDIFTKLNNKSKIPEWTNGKYLPRRQVVPIEAFNEVIEEWDLPVVIKPGDELPTAGGYGVMICYTSEDLEAAKKRIARAKHQTDTLIIEECIDAVENYCVQYALHPDHGIVYIGSAKQLTNAYGFYNGNINAIDVPDKVIEAGRELMQIGVDHGFIGIAGFDLLVDAKGDVYAIDLNYRQNGSTSMLLLAPLLKGKYHKFYSYFADGDNERFFKTIVEYVEKGVLYPLSYYDGDWYQDEQVNSRFAGIWHADHEEDIALLEHEFEVKAGLLKD